jgi:hypothetical protein
LHLSARRRGFDQCEHENIGGRNFFSTKCEGSAFRSIFGRHSKAQLSKRASFTAGGDQGAVFSALYAHGTVAPRAMTGGAGESGFGPHLTPQEAIRRLTTLRASGCTSCATGGQSSGAGAAAGAGTEQQLHRTRSMPVPTLRHYTRASPAVPHLELARPPSAAPKPESPSSPPSFWSFFDKGPASPSSAGVSPSSSFEQRPGSMVVPPLWSDMHDHHDFSTP